MAESLPDVHAEIDRLEAKHAQNPQGRFFVPLANAYRKGGDLERAESLLREGLRHHPDYLSAHIVLGRCLEDRGAMDEAANEFRYVLSVDPQNLIALRTLGDLAAASGRPAEAAQCYDQLLAADPMNDDARRALQALAPDEEPAPGTSEVASAGSEYDASFESFEPSVLPESPAPVEHGSEADELPAFGLDAGDEPLDHAVITETIAELYARQGLHERAAAVYRELIRRRAGDPVLEARLAEVEDRIREATSSREHFAEAPEESLDELGTTAASTQEASVYDEPALTGAFDPFDDSFGDGFPDQPAAQGALTIAGYLRELVSWSGRPPGSEERPPAAAAQPEGAREEEPEQEEPEGEPWLSAAPRAPAREVEPVPVEPGGEAYETFGTEPEPRSPEGEPVSAGAEGAIPQTGLFAGEGDVSSPPHEDVTFPWEFTDDYGADAAKDARGGVEEGEPIPAEHAGSPASADAERTERTEREQAAPPAEAVPPAPADEEEEEDDLESFQAWLRSLKR